MSKQKKTKNAGKFIIIMLCFAILFFLLLPFLEDPSSGAGKQARLKKPSPQIFTSNPLTELAHKLYTLFSGRTHEQNRTKSLFATAGQTFMPPPDGLPFPAAGTEEGPSRAAADAPRTSDNEYPSASSYFPETYDYGRAEFLNEDGEWVLVRQTAPDAAQRGMHDINTSDTPYDRLVRLERAAKYMPAQSPASIPDSRLARWFSPLKNWFRQETSARSMQPDSSASAQQTPSAAAVSPADGLGLGSTRRPTQRFQRAEAPSLDIPNSSAENESSRNTGPNNWSILDILDTEQSLEHLRDSVNDWYQPANGAQELPPADKKRREEALKIIAEKHTQFRQERLSQIQRDAARQQAVGLEQTFRCYGEATASYQETPPSACSLRPSQEEKEQQQQQEMAQARQQKEISLNKLKDTLGFAPPPLNIVIVLGKEPARFQTEDEISAQELTKEFYNYVSSSNCPDGNCYWVAATNEAQALATAMGGELYTDPLNLAQNNLQSFKEAKLQQAREDGQNEEEIQQLQTELDGLNPPYVAYNTQQWNELQAPPSSSNPGNKVKPSLFITPTAANAQTFAEDTRLPAAIFYDTTGKVLNVDSGLTPARQGAIVADQVVQRVGEVKKEMEDLEKTLARMRLDGALSDQMQQAQRELEQKKKEWEQLREAVK